MLEVYEFYKLKPVWQQNFWFPPAYHFGPYQHSLENSCVVFQWSEKGEQRIISHLFIMPISVLFTGFIMNRMFEWIN